MRTTLDLSDSLLEEAMALTKIRTKQKLSHGHLKI